MFRLICVEISQTYYVWHFPCVNRLNEYTRFLPFLTDFIATQRAYLPYTFYREREILVKFVAVASDFFLWLSMKMFIFTLNLVGGRIQKSDCVDNSAILKWIVIFWMQPTPNESLPVTILFDQMPIFELNLVKELFDQCHVFNQHSFSF